MARTLVVTCGAALAGTLAAGAQQQTFRAGADAVVVDVSVEDGNRPVEGLTAQDFQLRDNNVPQVIGGVTFGTLPIDVRLLVDLSSSITDEQLARLEAAMQSVEGALSPDDRCEISTFARRTTEVAPLSPAPVARSAALSRPVLDGTSFYDAAILAMATLPEPGRRQLTMILTDAKDNRSFQDNGGLVAAARHTDAVVFAITPEDPHARDAGSATLGSLTGLTGGLLLRAPEHGDLGPTLTAALTRFRETYVLYYTPAGVARAGWHTIVITVPTSKKYVIRARRGYVGG